MASLPRRPRYRYYGKYKQHGIEVPLARKRTANDGDTQAL